MTLRSLFSIILKIFGLIFVKDIVESVPQLISSVIFFITSGTGGFWTLVLALLIIAFYVFVSYNLFFKTNKILDILNLDKCFNQDELSFNIPSTTIFTIAIIIIGGVILANEIPNFCRYLYLYFQERRITFGQTQPDISYVVFAGVKIIIGLLLIGERWKIVEFLEKRQDQKY